jgi:nucleoside-diphosphate-sugar epimerase
VLIVTSPSSNRPLRRALLTGSTGFIGQHLARHLHAADWEVHTLVRRNAEPVSPFITKTHLYKGNTNDVMTAVAISRPDVVFHLASLFLAAHTPMQIQPLIESNILFGTQLLEGMRESGAGALVNAGTAWQHFQTDGYNPVNLYAATKQAFEDVIAYYVDAHGIRVTTLSLFDSYGPDDTRKKLLRLLIDALRSGESLQMSGGEQLLDLVHIDDICAAFLHAADMVTGADHPPVSAYSVTGGQRRTLREIVATLESVAGTSIHVEWGARPYREREVMQLWTGPDLPGWKPRISLEQGFAGLLRSGEVK